MSYDQDLAETLELLEALDEYKRFHSAEYFLPYPKQLTFMAEGKTKRERMFMAGNRVGKTYAGAFETQCHLTGRYPEWWEGCRFEHPITAWAAGKTSQAVRDVVQSQLCGPYSVASAFGTGMIAKEDFADKPTLARGITDAFDTIQIKHRTNGVEDGVSVLAFKSYEQGRQKFQGQELDFGWCDEESDEDIYNEFLTRINGPGRMIVTFTPLLGRTALVQRFEEPNPSRSIVHMSLDEAQHFTEEQKLEKLAGYASYERDARRYGTPLLGSGRVFPYSEEMIREPFLSYVPPHWVKLWGVDFGVDHPFAASLILWDRDNDVIHVHQAFKMVGDERAPQNSQPLFQAAAIKAYGAGVPVAWPHDGHQREKGGGGVLASIYKRQGLLMLPTHATWPEGGYSTEAGIKEISDRIVTNRFKVSEHLGDWFEEYRFYHRKDGQIVKERDDILSATRIALMQKRSAQAVPLGNKAHSRRYSQSVAQGLDFDIFET